MRRRKLAIDCARQRLSAADRLAAHIIGMIDCEHDPKTISDWAMHVNSSAGTIRGHCRVAHVRPQHARDLGRVLRGVYRSRDTWLPDAVLDCADMRTLNKIMDFAGLSGRRGKSVPKMLEVLERQRWISQDHPTLAALIVQLNLTTTRPVSDDATKRMKCLCLQPLQ